MNNTQLNMKKVLRTLEQNENSLGLQKYKLYECICILKWGDIDSFNSSSMGIRFIDEYTAIINPYKNTDTYKIILNSLKSNNKKKLTLNFSDNPVFYAKSALIGNNKGKNIQEIEKENLIVYDEYAYLKNANMSLLVETISELTDFSEKNKEFIADFSNFFSEYDGKIVKKKFLAKFDLNILERYISKYPSQPANRGDNLALEAIILSSKLPAFTKDEDILLKLLSKIRYYEKEIRRFSANKNALICCELIDNFISDLI